MGPLEKKPTPLPLKFISSEKIVMITCIIEDT